MNPLIMKKIGINPNEVYIIQLLEKIIKSKTNKTGITREIKEDSEPILEKENYWD